MKNKKTNKPIESITMGYPAKPFKEDCTDHTDIEYRFENCPFNFECFEEWDGLERTDDPKIRHCTKCLEDVHLCESPQEFAQMAKLRVCVAIKK